MSTGFLDDEALRRLTGRARANDQEQWLKAEGLPYKRPGKHLLVMWTHVQAWIEGEIPQAVVEPDLSAVDRMQEEYEAKKAMWAEKRAQKAALAAVATSQRKDRSSAP